MNSGYPTQTRRRFDLFRLSFAAFLILTVAGCSPRTGAGITGGLDRADRSVATPRTDQSAGRAPSGRPESVVAEIDGRAIRWEDIRSRVIESAAPEALRKLILERRLETMCAQQGLEVGEPEYAVEREQIERSMIGAGLALDSADAGRMLERVRRERGLGTVRYESLIRTNAMLRALVSESAEPDEPELRRGYDALYGPRLRVRLITAGSFDEATRLVRLARDGTDFAELAVRFSADPSAARGGLLEAMSVHDESYPLAVRAAAKELQAGGGAGGAGAAR